MSPTIQAGQEQNVEPFVFKYINHGGQEGERRVIVLGTFFGTSKYYTKPQWLLECWDLDKQAIRHYALNKLNLVRSSEVPT